MVAVVGQGHGVLPSRIRRGSVCHRFKLYSGTGKNILKIGGFLDFKLAYQPASLAVCILPAQFHGARGKIDLHLHRVVVAPQVGHQHPVDEHPHVVVAGELIGDGLAVAIALWPGVAAVLLDELGGHGHAEVIVKRGVRGRILCGVAVKGKEHPLPFVSGVTAALYSPGVIEGKLVDAVLLAEHREVGGFIASARFFCLPLGRVIIIVAVAVDLEQALGVLVHHLALSVVRAEQVVQVLVTRRHCDAVPGGETVSQDWKTILVQRFFHHALAVVTVGTRPLAGVNIDVASIFSIFRAEFQRAPRVDAVGLIGRAICCAPGFPLSVHPVVKYVDGGAYWGHALHRLSGRCGLGRQGPGGQQPQAQRQRTYQAYHAP